MRATQQITDKLSIGLSLLCAIHCWMLWTVISVGIYALTMGCKHNKRFRLLFVGGTGHALLILTVMLGEEIIGKYGEKTLTLTGASLVAAGHFWNFRFCRQLACACPEPN